VAIDRIDVAKPQAVYLALRTTRSRPSTGVVPRPRLSEQRSGGVDPEVPPGTGEPPADIADQSAAFVYARVALRDEEPAVGVHRGSAPMNDSSTSSASWAERGGAFAALHVFRRGARRLERVHCQRPSPIAYESAPHGRRSARRSTPAAEQRHARSAGAAIIPPGLFLFARGNGKTCIAERITATFGHEIWIPGRLRGRRIIRLYTR